MSSLRALSHACSRSFFAPLLFKDTAVLFISLIPVPPSSQYHPAANHRLLQLNTIENSQIQVAPGNLWGLTTKFIKTRSSRVRLLGSEISMQSPSEEHLHCLLTQSFAFGFLLCSFRARFFSVSYQRGAPGVWSHCCHTPQLSLKASCLLSRSAKLLALGRQTTVSFLLIQVSHLLGYYPAGDILRSPDRRTNHQCENQLYIPSDLCDILHWV